jgi:predicted nucleic acid-binding protein
MTAFLLDTNVLSEIVRPKPTPKVEAFLAREGDLWLSVIALHEFAHGLARVADATRRGKLGAWIESIKISFRGRIIDVGEPIAETAGLLRASSASHGRPLAPLDSLIAATALIHSKVLATRNVKDFAHLDVDLINPWEH